MNRRNFILTGLSFSAIATIPIVQTLAQAKQLQSSAQNREIEKSIAAEMTKPEAKLTTHVLDITNGKPAAGMRIDFSVLEGDSYRLLKTIYTNQDGRTDEPLLVGEAMKVGRYEQVFYVAEYYTKLALDLPDPPFLDKVPLRFAIFDAAQKYHVPLLCTPWSYSTYRGS